MSPSEVILECSFEAAIFKDSSCVRHRKIRYLASYISGRSLDDNNRAIFKSYQKNFYPKEFFSYIIYSLEINISDRCQLIYQKLYMPWCQHRHISPPVARVPLGTNTYKVSCKIAGRLWPWQIMRERVGNKKRQKAWGGLESKEFRRWYLWRRREKSMGIQLISIWIKFQQQEKTQWVQSLLLGIPAADQQNYECWGHS